VPNGKAVGIYCIGRPNVRVTPLLYCLSALPSVALGTVVSDLLFWLPSWAGLLIRFSLANVPGIMVDSGFGASSVN